MLIFEIYLQLVDKALEAEGSTLPYLNFNFERTSKFFQEVIFLKTISLGRVLVSPPSLLKKVKYLARTPIHTAGMLDFNLGYF